MVQLINFSIRLRMVYDTTCVAIGSLQSSRFSTTVLVQPKHDHKYTFENAIICLNLLQSNALTVQQSAQIPHDQLNENVEKTAKYLIRSGITLNDLDKLNVIHVAGTKGKGSTCAFTESILRTFGLKTGFYSSPHLSCVTERFRINGKPISKVKFNKYFWKVYKSLDLFKDNKDDMPPYFKFLTIMAFHVFFGEKVNVAIVEVGIGGEHDCTNVLRNTKTVGITSLGLEHTKILGNTLTDIAWQKAGIIKENSNAFTVAQRKECDEILWNRAREKSAHLNWAPDFDSYHWLKRKPNSTLLNNNTVQHSNVSLSIQLCYDFLKRYQGYVKNKQFLQNLRNNDNAICLDVPDEVISGIEKCVWPGRFQVVHLKNIRIFLDGAHTIESLDKCLEWFNEHTKENANKKYILFNTTGDRNCEQMLNLIHSKGLFDAAYFSPNISLKAFELKDTSFNANSQNKCASNANYWNLIQNKNLIGISKDTNESISSSKIFSCISEVIGYVIDTTTPDDNTELLVTGSIHLVGATLETIKRFKDS